MTYIDLRNPRPAPWTGRRGDWMVTRSGGRFYPVDPRFSEVTLDDIATSLSRQCRYAGHCSRFYSVAEHSVYVSRVVPREFAMHGLLHDASETWCVDVPRPVKRELAGYTVIEARCWRAVAEWVGINPYMPDCVKEADDAVLMREKASLMKHATDQRSVAAPPADIRIPEFWTLLHFSYFAKRMFLKRFHEIVADLGL